MDKCDNIYAITVSKNYSNLLKILLEHNHCFFEKWFIVTQEDDESTINLVNKFNKPNIELILYPLQPSLHKKGNAESELKTKEDLSLSIPSYLKSINGKKLSNSQQTELDSLTKNGVSFDKGGALRQVQKLILPKHNIKKNDLVVLLDSDIVLPKNFRDIIRDKEFLPNRIYYCDRANYIFYSDFLENNIQVDKKTKPGSGFFQLYRYDDKKLCKRTYTCAWVDWEFKGQFSNAEKIKNLVVSHLGETDMNWKGVTTESFLYDEDINDYCIKHEIELGKNLSESKFNIIKHIQSTRLMNMDRKYGLPDVVLFGLPCCGLKILRKKLEADKNISSFQNSHNELSFFGTETCFDELWNMSPSFYLNSFPPLYNHTWIDSIKILTNNNQNEFLRRLKIIYKDRLKLWREFPLPKFIFMVRNPMDRILAEYKHFNENFPSSANWNWIFPGSSFSKNIFSELSKSNKHNNQLSEVKSGSFVKNGCYISYFSWLIKNLEIPRKNLCFIEYNELNKENNKNLNKKLSEFLGKEIKSNFIAEDYLFEKLAFSDVNKNTISYLKKYYASFNDKLNKLTGINYNE